MTEEQGNRIIELLESIEGELTRPYGGISCYIQDIKDKFDKSNDDTRELRQSVSEYQKHLDHIERMIGVFPTPR